MHLRMLSGLSVAALGAAAFLVASTPTPAQAQSACISAAQGRIAWDYKGNKRWAQGNLNRLCRGATNAAPANCFQRVMHGNINWGGGTQWKWENAIDLCEQSKDANRTISCFQKNLSGGDWKAAIAKCDERAPQLPACQAALQGQVAWDYKGNKQWAPGNLTRLCRNSNDDQPARCFQRVMHGGINWGGSTQWKWENAIDLCEQSKDANRTVSCFQRKIGNGQGWQQAIEMCDERAPDRVSCKDAAQGRIAWDYKGNKQWAPGNLTRLCRGGQDDEPAKCFQRVMHGNISWGGGTQWKWENAIDLCEGSQNADRTVRCFQKRIKNGRSWKQAIERCDERRKGRRGRR